VATLNDLIDCMCRFAEANEKNLTKDFCVEFKTHLQKQFPGEKVYIPAADMSKKAQIAEAAKRLPTGVVAARMGVSHSWVRKVVKRGG
jgi:hypothetical protein